MLDCAPSRVTDRAAAATASRSASALSPAPPASATANAALNTSPAAVVSTTGTRGAGTCSRSPANQHRARGAKLHHHPRRAAASNLASETRSPVERQRRPAPHGGRARVRTPPAQHRSRSASRSRPDASRASGSGRAGAGSSKTVQSRCTSRSAAAMHRLERHLELQQHHAGVGEERRLRLEVRRGEARHSRRAPRQWCSARARRPRSAPHRCRAVVSRHVPRVDAAGAPDAPSATPPCVSSTDPCQQRQRARRVEPRQTPGWPPCRRRASQTSCP